MAQVVAFEDVKSRQFTEVGSLRTPFLNHYRDHKTKRPADQDMNAPVAFLSQGAPGRVLRPHYHNLDEFVVVTGGSGTFGRIPVAPYSVFFARAYTPYGPITGDSVTGLSFLVLFARFDPGAEYLPGSMEKLKQVPDRHPLQIKRSADFPCQPASLKPGAVVLRHIPDIADDQGLAAYTLTMGADARIAAPDHSTGDGQYIVVVEGGLQHGGREHQACTLIFIERGEGTFELQAGAAGLQAIVLNFPRRVARIAATTAPAAAAGFRKWQCELCAFAYDEAAGLPDDGIAPGTRWEDVPESWVCPDCAAAKSDFQMVEVRRAGSMR